MNASDDIASALARYEPASLAGEAAASNTSHGLALFLGAKAKAISGDDIFAEVFLQAHFNTTLMPAKFFAQLFYADAVLEFLL